MHWQVCLRCTAASGRELSKDRAPQKSAWWITKFSIDILRRHFYGMFWGRNMINITILRSLQRRSGRADRSAENKPRRSVRAENSAASCEKLVRCCGPSMFFFWWWILMNVDEWWFMVLYGVSLIAVTWNITTVAWRFCFPFNGWNHRSQALAWAEIPFTIVNIDDHWNGCHTYGCHLRIVNHPWFYYITIYRICIYFTIYIYCAYRYMSITLNELLLDITVYIHASYM